METHSICSNPNVRPNSNMHVFPQPCESVHGRLLPERPAHPSAPGEERQHGGRPPAQHLSCAVAWYSTVTSDPRPPSSSSDSRLTCVCVCAGVSVLLRLLSASGDETQPGLPVLLCEILTAVFLGLFVHGLATHSSHELFRTVAHPLNGTLWLAVFGGGARAPVPEKPSSPTGSALLLLLFVC